MPSYDLFSASFKANPHATFATMRREQPIYGHEDKRTGQTIWYFTTYADTVAVMRDPRFIKDPSKLDKAISAKNKSLTQAINENMLFSDPPDHTRLRGLVNQAFTPRRVEQMTGQIEVTVDELINDLTPPADLIADYALPLAVRVISDLLGIPSADRNQVAHWSQAIISPSGRGLKSNERKRMMRHFVAYLNNMFAERQANPQDDLITALVQAEEAGERLNASELSSMVALLLVTGHETTVNLIGNGVLALLQHPDQLALLLDNPGLSDSAVEELLRFDGPVETSTTRWVGEDLVYQGYAMQKGDVVRVVITSANRDDAVFTCPHQLDITRSNNRHLQFGHGIHYCLGAPLARLEGKIGILTLLQRLPNLRLADPDNIHFRPGVLFRGLQSLVITWD